MTRAALLVASAACLGACGGAAARGRAFSGANILRVVPADTPYVYAALEPFPREYLDRFIREQRPELQRTLEQRGGVAALPPGDELFYTFLRELEPYYSVDGLDRLGIGRNGAWVLYGMGLVPALRVELAAPEKLAAFLDGVARKSRVPIARESLGDHRYWIVRAGAAAMVWAIDGNALVATIAPPSLLGDVLPLLFGDRLPARSLADTNAIPALARAYGLAPVQVLSVDFVRLLGALTDPQQELDRKIRGAMALDVPELDAACRSELPALAADAPRLVLGAEELSPARERYRLTLELSPRMVRLLGALRARAAGVGAPLGTALARFGAAADVRKAVDLAKLWSFAVRTSPYRCALLRGLNRLARDLARELDAPLPAWMEPLRGASLVIFDADFTRLRGYGVVTAADPLQVVGTLTALVPSLRGVNLPPDGTPVALPAALGPIDHVAVRGNVVGVSAGGAESDLSKAVAAPIAPTAPMVQMAFDADRVRQAFGALADGWGDVAGRWDIGLYLDDRGLTLRVERLRSR